MGNLRDHLQDVRCLGLIGLLRPTTVLTKDPSNDLHQCIWDVLIFLQNLEVNLDSAISEFLTTVAITLVLTYAGNEFVSQLGCNLVSTNLKELVHVLDVPILVGRKFIAQDTDFIDQVLA